ncbi:MAG: alpha/beta hydrolase [Deltaproteobacteria bacterium]
MLGVVRRAVAGSDSNGGQRNVVGYSYGSVVGAHAALELARQGQRVDNLVLVGSPIHDGSDLQRALLDHANIGNVLRVDIHGDPASNGISPSQGANGCGSHPDHAART